MSAPALEAVGLTHTFAAGTPSEQVALQDVDLVMEPRSWVVVLGANGSGKSTLLNAIAGSLIPDRGRVRLGGHDVTHWHEWRRAAMIGRVFQNPATGSIGHLTVAENLAVAAKRGAHRAILRNPLNRGGRRELADHAR